MMESLAINWHILERDLKGFVYKRVGDKALSEDIVHDVFLKAQRRIKQLNDRGKFSAWIYQIARNAIIDHYRKNKKTVDVRELHWESDAPNFNDCILASLTNMLRCLPDKYRIALELADLQNISQTEVAEMLGISYTAVKARVQRARKMLKEKIDQAHIIETDPYGNVIVCRDRIPC